jgi:NAD(P)-dependent dehydrogenase (short-subunit alcohol dehydrogenase family)
MAASRFDGKVALVTGASAGLGRAIAVRLAAEGAAVGLVGRDREALAAATATIEGAGGVALPLVGDLRRDADVAGFVAALRERHGSLDLLAHAAGALRLGPLTELREDDWDLIFETNVKSCFLLARHAVPAMREAGGGAIVNVSSVFGAAASPGAAAYAASKAAVDALTRTMALDHIGEGIRVNCVAPGSMRTEMLERAAAERSPEDPEAALAAIGAMHPSGRLIATAEVASLVLYLLSDEAGAIVGTTYTIDGGRLAKLGTAA